MIKSHIFIILLLITSNIFSQKEFNIRSLINIDGIYKEVISMKPAAGLVFTKVKNKKMNMGKLINGKKQGHWTEMHRDERRLEETYKDGQLDG